MMADDDLRTCCQALLARSAALLQLPGGGTAAVCG
jgi:hypothetical protein